MQKKDNKQREMRHQQENETQTRDESDSAMQ